jgi:hypothetical protein
MNTKKMGLVLLVIILTLLVLLYFKDALFFNLFHRRSHYI